GVRPSFQLVYTTKRGATKTLDRGQPVEGAIERPEETHARHSRSSALARTESRRERRIWQVQARAHALRPLHGGGGRAGLSRHRGSPRAGPAAGAVEAARRARLRLSAPPHREVLWGLYLVEIPSAGALNVERHLYEKVVLVVEGRGTTEVWQEGQGKRHVFEWQKGSLFSIPLNAYHRLVNAANAPALLLCGTSAPNVMNVIDNAEFVFNCPYTFSD